MRQIKNRVINEVRHVQGYKVCVLCNHHVEVAVAPGLGARILSLRNLRSRREWMWHPGEILSLFTNKTGDDFARSTLAGADECIPTIAPCVWKGRQLPDHGEAWSVPWQEDVDAWHSGRISTTVDLPVSPLRLKREIGLEENTIVLNYALTNKGHVAEEFLWAFHPLFRMEKGDRLELPPSTREMITSEQWVEDFGITPSGGCSKLFAGPLSERKAAIINTITDDRLEFSWTGDWNNLLGLWLTKGGWNGHHHVAVEPTNGAPDSLAEAAAAKCCGTIEHNQSLQWQTRLTLSSRG